VEEILNAEVPERCVQISEPWRAFTRHRAETDVAARWQQYEREHPQLLASARRMFAFQPSPSDLLALAADEPRFAARVQALGLEERAAAICALLGYQEPAPLRATVLVGCFEPTAWCDENSANDVFFCVEKLPDDPNRCGLIAAHELTHAAHLNISRFEPGAWPVSRGLHAEALAIAVTLRLFSQLPATEHLGLEHPARTLDAYQAAERPVHETLLGLLECCDEDAYRDVFYPDWGRPQAAGLPEQVGYLIACQAAQRWNDTNVCLARIARWDDRQARKFFAATLTGRAFTAA